MYENNKPYFYNNISSFLDHFKNIVLKILNIGSKKKNNEFNRKGNGNNERFRTLFELAPDGIMTINIFGVITSANAAYYELTGYSPYEILGKHMFQLDSMVKSNLIEYKNMFKDFMKGKKPKVLEFNYRHKNGTIRWAEARAELVNTKESGLEIITILRDITDRKEKDRKLLNVLNELKRSNRELDDYTYAVSHDLKAPLRTIQSFSNFIIEDYYEKFDDDGKEYLERIVNASNRMQIFIDDLLLLSRVGRKNIVQEVVDINQIVESIKEDLIEMISNKNGELIYDALPSFVTQRVWIRQMFYNLINNGFKFNQAKLPKVWVYYEDLGDSHKFSVKDNGIGIDKKYYDKIFKIFQRLHSNEEYKGTGAGLSICKKIIDTWGGKIWVESKVGHGSTFFFTIPKNIKVNVLERGSEITLVDDVLQNEIHAFHG